MAGQVWVTNSLGGYMYSDNLSKELRMAVQPLVKFRQFCDVKDATQQGKSKGQLFHWNVYNDVATQGTSLTETNTMPETQFTITQGFGLKKPLHAVMKVEKPCEIRGTPFVRAILSQASIEEGATTIPGEGVHCKSIRAMEAHGIL